MWSCVIPGTDRPHAFMGLLGKVPFGTAIWSTWSAFELGPYLNRTRGNEWNGSKWIRIRSEKFRSKVVGELLLFFFWFFAHLLGRCLLRNFGASVPMGTSLLEMQGPNGGVQ